MKKPQTPTWNKMKYAQLLTVLMIGIFFVSCNQKIDKPEPNPFAGLWSLHIMEEKDSLTGQWSEWRSGMQGYILYDGQDNMAVHLTTKGYEDTPLRFPNFTDTISDAALKHLTGSYVYFAKYTVDTTRNVVEHARISHSNPGLWNEVVKRRFTFTGDTLILQPLEDQNAALRLKWVRERVSGNH
jgi:hypothetical protein